MCGIVAWLGQPLCSHEETKTRVRAMAKSMAHRGPNDEGTYQDPRGRPAYMSHVRLAIIDPENGHQPMANHDGQVCLVFNGAIYNYLELRRELKARGHQIISYSDTEVLLHAYLEWGEQSLTHLNGMFAFAIWDGRNQRLFAARDRMGIKPLYYYFDGHRLLVFSEIKALWSAGVVRPAIDSHGLADYLALQYTLGAKTMFRGVTKLEPGHCLSATLQAEDVSFQVHPWWEIVYDIDLQQDEEYFTEKLAFLINDAIRLQLRADVPVGAHLSGGMDSSVVVCAAAQHLEGLKLKTFTGAFREADEFDESAYARLVALEAGTEYHEVYVTCQDFLDLIPKLLYFMDEPAAGPGLLPQYLVSYLASKEVKVVLGGQGGDELFLGYARYLLAYLEACLKGAIWETADPKNHAATLQTIISSLPLLQGYLPMMQHFWREGLFEEPDRRYYRLVQRSGMHGQAISPEVLDHTYQPFDSFREIFNQCGQPSLINKISSYELKASLPALLQVEDRTSMAVSLESRLPLLDHRIVELMARVPPTIKFKNGHCKHLFRRAVYNLIPQAISQRQDKKGFPVPLNIWLAGPAQDFVRDILHSPRARQRGFYNQDVLDKVLEGEGRFGRAVWGLLCLELWQRAFLDGGAD